ncbi:MAG: hypothetical protein JXB32_04765 [Deltaproteobacteria bacterium]|nr:hypothetical protein [Deltaproteobacteria bacterium]
MDARAPLLAVAFAFGAALPARADPPPDDRAVDLVVAGTREDATAVAEVVAELLRRFELRLRAARAERLDPAAVATPDPEAPPAVARVWIDLLPPSGNERVWQVAIYVVDGEWERTRIRRVAVLGGVDEVAREELAHAIASGVEGILSGKPLDLSHDELCHALGLSLEAAPPDPDVPPPEPVPVRVPPPPGGTPAPAVPHGNELEFDLSLGYELTGFADQTAISHGPFAALGVALRREWLRPALELTLQYRPTLAVEDDPFGVRLDQALFRLVASVAIPVASLLRLVIQLGGGLDVVWTEPTAAEGETARPAEPSTAYFGVVRAAAGLRVRLGGSFALLALVGCDIDGRHRSYVSYDAGARRMVLEPWTVRPLALLTFAFDMLDPLGDPEATEE